MKERLPLIATNRPGTGQGNTGAAPGSEEEISGDYLMMCIAIGIIGT